MAAMEPRPCPQQVGIESDVLDLLPDPPLARARIRVDNEGVAERFPDGDWLNVRVSARLFDPQAAQQGRFDEPVAAGPELEATARADSWTLLDLPLPPVVLREYSLAAKVLSADDRYPRPFSPSKCRLVRARFGSFVRLGRAEFEGLFRTAPAGNPAAAAEIRRWVRDGVVLVEDGGRWFRVEETESGDVQLAPHTAG